MNIPKWKTGELVAELQKALDANKQDSEDLADALYDIILDDRFPDEDHSLLRAGLLTKGFDS